MTEDDIRDSERLIVVSPHFDDAALSLGLTLAHRASRGLRSVVVNVFSGAPETDDGRALVARRWDEDRRALAMLGVDDIRSIGLLDAVYRTRPDGGALYPSRESLFWGQAPLDDVLLGQVMDGLIAVFSDMGDDAVLAVPLGAGGHVDHHLCHVAGQLLVDQGVTGLAYEDLPYAVYPGETDAALRRSRGESWRTLLLAGSDAALAAKMAAVNAYESQRDWFVADGIEGRLITHARSAGAAPSERIWLLGPR